MSGCHNCIHFKTDFEYAWYRSESDHLTMSCEKKHFYISSGSEFESTGTIRAALRCGDNCKDYHEQTNSDAN